MAAKVYAELTDEEVTDYPLSFAQVEEKFAGFLGPPPLDQFPEVLQLTPPAPSIDQEVVEGTPRNIDGIWTQYWTLVTVGEGLKATRLAAMLAGINTTRDAKIEGGFSHPVNGEAHRWQTNQSSRENILAKGDRADKVIIANPAIDADTLTWDETTSGEDFVFIDEANVKVPMGPFAMQGLRDAGEKFKQNLTFFADVLKGQVTAAAVTSLASAQLLIDAAGWPE